MATESRSPMPTAVHGAKPRSMRTGTTSTGPPARVAAQITAVPKPIRARSAGAGAQVSLGSGAVVAPVAVVLLAQSLPPRALLPVGRAGRMSTSAETPEASTTRYSSSVSTSAGSTRPTCTPMSAPACSHGGGGRVRLAGRASFGPSAPSRTGSPKQRRFRCRSLCRTRSRRRPPFRPRR